MGELREVCAGLRVLSTRGEVDLTAVPHTHIHTVQRASTARPFSASVSREVRSRQRHPGGRGRGRRSPHPPLLGRCCAGPGRRALPAHRGHGIRDCGALGSSVQGAASRLVATPLSSARVCATCDAQCRVLRGPGPRRWAAQVRPGSRYAPEYARVHPYPRTRRLWQWQGEYNACASLLNQAGARCPRLGGSASVRRGPALLLGAWVCDL